MDSLFTGNKRGFIEISNADFDESVLKVVQIENSVFEENMVEQSALVRSFQNTEARIVNSTFLKNYSFGTGTVLQSEYSNNVVRDSTVSYNYAVNAGNMRFINRVGVFLVTLQSIVDVHNCSFLENFGLTNGVFDVINGGTLNFYDSRLENNHAIEGKIHEPIMIFSVHWLCYRFAN